MIKCKCRICGKEHSVEEAYKVVINNKNRYFCSQEEYETHIANKKREEKLVNDIKKTICYIFGAKTIVNTQIYKEWQQWNQVATNEIIFDYLTENKEMIRCKIEPLEGDEYSKIRYLSSIIKNSICNYQKPSSQKHIKATTIEEYIIKYLDPTLCFKTDVPDEEKTKAIINPSFEDDRLIAEAVKQLSYREFLETPYWETISYYRRFKSNFKCKKCGSSENTQTHHLTYERHGYEHRIDVMKNDLIVLCRKCHHKVHGITDSDDEI